MFYDATIKMIPIWNYIKRHSRILTYAGICLFIASLAKLNLFLNAPAAACRLCTLKQMLFFRHCLCYNQSVVLFIELEIVPHLQFVQTIMGFIEFHVAKDNLEQRCFGYCRIKTNLVDLINK